MIHSAQPEIEEWSSWDEDAPTSIKIEGGNGNVSPSPNDVDEEPDYFKDMAPTIRKTQKVCSLDTGSQKQYNKCNLLNVYVYYYTVCKKQVTSITFL